MSLLQNPTKQIYSKLLMNIFTKFRFFSLVSLSFKTGRIIKVLGDSKGVVVMFAAPTEGRCGANRNLHVVLETPLTTDRLISAPEKPIVSCCVSRRNKSALKQSTGNPCSSVMCHILCSVSLTLFKTNVIKFYVTDFLKCPNLILFKEYEVFVHSFKC